MLEETWRAVIARVATDHAGGAAAGVAVGTLDGRPHRQPGGGTSAAWAPWCATPTRSIPPGRPDKLRTAHLANLRTPTLILQGERDPFGNPEEVAGYRLSPAVAVHWIGDGDHGFKPRKRSGRTLEQNTAEAVTRTVAFLGH